ncbi:MAG: glycine reductase, partial [SAR202 cluster bacterium]|nr:glycine reductase [SAR202 cluster bacterium]
MNDEQFNPAYRLAVSYIDKSRHFYAAQGYEIPYRWAVNDHVPFQKLTKPL